MLKLAISTNALAATANHVFPCVTQLMVAAYLCCDSVLGNDLDWTTGVVNGVVCSVFVAGGETETVTAVWCPSAGGASSLKQNKRATHCQHLI